MNSITRTLLGERVLQETEAGLVRGEFGLKVKYLPV